MLFSLLVALGYGAGLVSALVSCIQFIESRTHPAARQRAFTFLVAAIAFVTITYLLANQQSKAQGYEPGLPFAPTTGTSQPSTDSISTQFTFTPNPSPSPTPSPSPQPKSGDVLCQADASHAWSGWNGTNWISELYPRHPTIVAPCDLSNSPDYSTVVQMQITSPPSGDACFGIYVRGISSGGGWMGYAAVVDQGCLNGYGDTIRISTDTDQENQILTTAPFSPGTTTHTYLVEVKGTSIKLFIDGGLVLQTNDNRYLSGGQVGFFDSKLQLSISSFKIITL